MIQMYISVVGTYVIPLVPPRPPGRLFYVTEQVP